MIAMGNLYMSCAPLTPGALFFFPFLHILNVAEAQPETIKMKIEFLL